MTSTSVQNKAARIISTLFVPPSLTLFIFIFFALHLETTARNSIIVILVTLTFGFIFPIIVFLYLRKKGRIIDVDASIKEERTIPFLIGVFLYSAGLGVMLYSGVNPVTVSFWFCYITNTLIIIVINKYWKISAHAIGVAAPLAAITYVMGIRGLVFIILLVIVGWSRVKLKRHTVSQVIAGAILGFCFTLIQMKLIADYLH